MGRFFNQMVIGMKSIPGIKTKGNMEKLRTEFNTIVRENKDGKTVCSTKTEQDRIEYTDEPSERQPESVIPVVKEDRPRATRRTNKNRTRKARSDKGKRRASGIRES